MIRRLAVLLLAALPLVAGPRENVARGLLREVMVEGEPGMDIHARMQHYGVPGVSIAVWKDGKIQWTAAYGNATAKTLFQAGSISKSVAAVATLRVLAKHDIPLDTDVNAHLESWKLPTDGDRQPPTIAQILRHTAGLNVPGFPGFARGERIPSVIDELEGRGNTQPLRVAGNTNYSGGGYLLLQQLLVDLEDEPIEQILRREVLRPARMKTASFAYAPRNAASGVSEETGPIQGGAFLYPEKTAAGLWTNAEDLARFVIAFQTNELLPAATKQRMLDENMGVFRFKREYFAHPGGNTGFVALYVGHRTRPDGAVVLANAETADPLVYEILRAIAKEYAWPDYLRAPVKLAAVDASQYAGRRYAFDADDVISVRADGAQLVVTRTAEEPVRLDALSETEFIDRETGVTYTFADEQLTVHGVTIPRTREITPFEVIQRDYPTGIEHYRIFDPALLTEERLRERGVALRELGNLPAALALLEFNVQRHPASAAALDALATTQLAAGRAEDARATSQRVLEALKTDWTPTATWREVFRRRAEQRVRRQSPDISPAPAAPRSTGGSTR